MEGGEMYRFIKVWLTVLTSLCYCRTIGTKVPKGTKRLIFLLPVGCLFLFLPLNLSSPHLAGFTAFFIAWLANFKLLLFAFDKGPLSTANVISLPLFVVVACLPIKIQQTQPPKSHQINGHTKQTSSRKPKQGVLNYAVKGLVLAILIKVYDHLQFMHPNLTMLLLSLHMYFLLEFILAIGAATVRSFTSLELEPQFNKPYLSTSLQDFWGKRWNLTVPNILRPTVYEPTLRFSSAVIGRKWAPLPAVFATFVVSGLMHELMFYYLGRCCCVPTGEMSLFFVIHGFCLALEIVLKNALLLSGGKCELPWLVTGPSTVGFLLWTGIWLFIPQILRCKIDVRAFEEYAELGALLKNSSGNLLRIFSAKLKVLKAQS